MSTVKMSSKKVVKSVGSLFDNITTLADATNNLMKMAGNSSERMLKDQEERLVLHRKTYRGRLVADTALEQAEHALEIDKFRSKSNVHKEYYDKYHSELASAFDE